jgi:hypothetical protein
VTERLALLNLMAAFEAKRPGLALDRTKALAVGARVLGSEGLCLLLQEGVEGSLDQSAADLQGQFLHDAEVDVQSRPLGPERPPGHDFSPLGGEFTDFADVFRSWLDARHGLPSLALASWSSTSFLALYITSASK